jgi:filamentous hemagglutinin family protein
MTSHPDTGPRRSGLTRLLTLGSLLWLGGLLTVSQAQMTLDGSLGPRGPVPGPHYRIGADVGQIRGGNLFHSFGEFNVPRGGSATFAGPNTIANIVSRVTGGQQSVIDGRLRSEIAGANLYLLNPSGVLFGPNASLDVSGSFHVSTADYLRFADGATFSANLGQASVLTVAPPAAFGFLGQNPAAMTIEESVLEVPAGQTLSLVGGDITIVGGPEGFLSAPGGRIQLASVASPGEVGFSRLELAPDLQVDGFARLGRITLSQLALLDASGDGGGSVLLRSGRLLIDQSNMFADNTGRMDGAGLGLDLRITADAVIRNGSFLTTDSVGAGRARDLRLTAGSLHLDNAVAGSRSFASGDGGNVGVNVGTLALTGGAQISTSTFGTGRGGQLTVEASEVLSITGSGLFSNTYGLGDAGRLVISAPLLTMDNGGQIEAAASGDESRGNAGSLEVRVGRLTLTGGAEISTGTRGAGRGGQLTVEASDTIAISGLETGLFTNTFGEGAAGRLVVSAPLLTMDDLGLIQANGEIGDAGDIEVRVGRLALAGGAQIDNRTEGPGRGGQLTVEASDTIAIAGLGQGRLGLSPSGLFSTTFGRGDAGRLVVTAPTLSMEGGQILASTERSNTGNAGSLEVRVGRLALTGGAQISTGTVGTGRGGELRVVATDTIAISGGSGLVSSTFGEGAAGQLVVLAPSLMMDGGTIEAITAGAGRGGDIEVAATHLQLRNGSTILASSVGANDAGTIRLQIGETFRSDNGRVATASTRAGGGRIELQAGRLVQLRDSALTTSVQGGGGDAGNLILDAPFVVLEGSQIIANAFAGMGGNIRLGAEVFLADPVSLVEASSALGIQGMVDIQAPVTSLSGTLAPLPQAFVSAAALLPARCVARAQDGRYSSLVLGGREGLPVAPGGLLPSPLVPAERLAADPAVIGAPPPPSPATFTFLTGADKAFPRLGCPQ